MSPTGHHAARSIYGGYCFFNNAAIVAEHLAASTGSKVTVLDVDYHHGNGTQQIFTPRRCAVRVTPRRPRPRLSDLTGFDDEVGTGAGRGTTVNLPLPERTSDEEYLAALRGMHLDRAVPPDFVVVSLGLDTFVDDPIGDLAMTADGFESAGAVVALLGLPTVVLQEAAMPWTSSARTPAAGYTASPPPSLSSTGRRSASGVTIRMTVALTAIVCRHAGRDDLGPTCR